MAPAPRLAIVGPTASGKSALGLLVACRLGDMEIVSVDSMQVYRGMDIGTAKPSAAERRAVPHHLLDVADPSVEFTLSEYQAAAIEAVDVIERRRHRPLLVGGTGLYLHALVDRFAIPGRFPEVRASLEAEPDTAALHQRLQELDPVAAGRMEPTNRRRVVRALEVTVGSGRPFSSFGPGVGAYPDSSYDLVGLWVDPEVLAARIDARLRRQVRDGLLLEVRRLTSAGASLGRTAGQALAYKELLAHLEGQLSLDEAIELAVTRTRRFARRQRSWFQRDPRVTWFDATGGVEPLVEVLAEHWLG